MENDSAFFTLSRDSRAERLLSDVTAALTREIAALPCAGDLRGVILGGGYGRGEGGVFRRPDGSVSLYNDLDFFVISDVSASFPVIDRALSELAKNTAAQLGIDVDFAPARTTASLKKVASTLMFMELKRGHRVIFGPTNLLDALVTPDFAQVPPSEGARLLMNRGTGLLLASALRGEPSPEHSDFIERNLSKAVFGAGDALLISRGVYRPGIPLRAELLRTLPVAPGGLPEAYDAALNFKTYPYLLPFEEAMAHLPGGVQLYLASVRAFYRLEPEASAEAVFTRILCDDTTDEGNPGRNLLVNLAARLRGCRTGCWLNHPRRMLLARLFRLLSGLAEGHDPTSAEREEYLALWRRYN